MRMVKRGETAHFPLTNVAKTFVRVAFLVIFSLVVAAFANSIPGGQQPAFATQDAAGTSVVSAATEQTTPKRDMQVAGARVTDTQAADIRVADTFVPLGSEDAPAGTPQDPFLISTEADLVAFAQSVNGRSVENGQWVISGEACSYEGKTVCLVNDIELTSAFTPIGIGANTRSAAFSPISFSGIFDGRGHTISNLFITKASNPNINATAHGAQWFSALFGSINGASILNLQVELSPTATFTVKTLSPEASAGLVAQVVDGENIIGSCGVKGDITGGGEHLGGIIGRVEGGTLDLSYSYHQGTLVTGNSGGGLLCGINNVSVRIEHCYQYGAVSSTYSSSYASNFFGQLAGTGQTLQITGCVASENLPLLGANMKGSQSACVAGVASWNSDDVKAALGTDRFIYNEEDATQPPSLGVAEKASYTVTFLKGEDVAGKLPTMGKQQEGVTFALPSANLTQRGYSFSGWRVVDAQGVASGMLYAAGDAFTMPQGDVDFLAQWEALEPVLISNEQELRLLAADVNAGALDTDGKVYELASDITLTRPWTPLGTGEHPFEGVFNGAGHVIYGLSVTDETLSSPYLDATYAGFFGYASGAIIRNLGIEGSVDATSATYTGGLVGLASGALANADNPEDTVIIEGCYVRANVSAAGYVGGLVGQAVHTTLASSYMAGSVTLASDGIAAGGLVGRYQSARANDMLSCAVDGCYSAAAVHTFNENAHIGLLFGLINETYANIEAGQAWNRMQHTFCLEGGFPVYSTVSAFDAVTAASSEADQAYVRSAEQLCAPGLASELGSAYRAATTQAEVQANQGYPLLTWQQVAASDRSIAVTVHPATAQVMLVDATTGEQLLEQSDEASPSRHAFLANPLHDVVLTVSAEGYETQTATIPADQSSISQEVTLTAVSYSITYNLLGGTWAQDYAAPQTYTIEHSVALPSQANLAKEGYDFVGWKTFLTASEFVEEIPAGQTGNVTLFAWWRIKEKAPVVVGALPYAAAGDYRLVTYVGSVEAGSVVSVAGKPLYWNGAAFVTLLPASEARALYASDCAVQPGERAEFTRGDVNDNARVNIVDAQIAYDIAKGSYSDFSVVSLKGWLAADENADSVVDATDAFAIQYSFLHTSNQLTNA